MTTTTLGAARQRIMEMSQDNHDEVVPPKSLLFHDLQTVTVDGAVHRLSPTAQRAIATRWGVPYSYLLKCPPHIQAENLNYWLSMEEAKGLFLRMCGNEEVRAIFSTRYVPVDNLEVVTRLLECGFDEEAEVQLLLDDTFMSLSIPDHSLEFSVMGDWHAPGITISNSEVGISALRVSQYIYRLVCSNGMVVPEEKGLTAYRHVSMGVIDKFMQQIAEIHEVTEWFLKMSRQSKEIHVLDPHQTLEELGEKFSLGRQERAAVAWGFSQEPGDSHFHVVNAFTKGSQFPTLSIESCHRLQYLGGRVLTEMVN